MKVVSPNNVSADTIALHSRALSWAHQIRIKYLNELQATETKRSKHPLRKEDFDKILSEMKARNLFSKVEGREGFQGFADMPSNIYVHKNSKDLDAYTREHIAQFKRLKHHHTDFTLNVDKKVLEEEEEIDRNFCFDNETPLGVSESERYILRRRHPNQSYI